MSALLLDEIAAGAIGVLLLSAFALYLYCFFDVRRRAAHDGADRAHWLNTLWQMPVVGSILYLSRRKRD